MIFSLLKQETLLARMKEDVFQLDDVLENPLIGILMEKFLEKMKVDEAG
jgi:hypothetical protein